MEKEANSFPLEGTSSQAVVELVVAAYPLLPSTSTSISKVSSEFLTQWHGKQILTQSQVFHTFILLVDSSVAYEFDPEVNPVASVRESVVPVHLMFQIEIE